MRLKYLREELETDDTDERLARLSQKLSELDAEAGPSVEEPPGEDPLEDEELEDLPEDDLEDEGDLPELPELPEDELPSEEPMGSVWEPTEVPDKRDLAFRRDDGFMMRARKYKSVPNKWQLQIWVGKKVLDHGWIFVPEDEDPAEFFKEVADYMLDTDSYRFQQAGEEEELEPLGPEPEELEEPGEREEMGEPVTPPAPGEGEELPPEEEEELELSDEDFELEE